MAINALLSTWTTFDDGTRRLIWEKDVPKEVKTTVDKAASFVNKHIFGLQYQPWNAFFSGSVKGYTTHTNYPINRHETSGFYLHGVEGIIPEDEYMAQCKKQNCSVDFHGYNSYTDYWPFWCSEPYTYVTTMLALAKYSNTFDA